MTVSPDLRSLLAKTVLEARRAGEAAGRQSLEALAVDRTEPHGSMLLGERHLRNRLRARGRQLGDRHDQSMGTQKIDRLAHEVAYEQWHRMLFARFLAETACLVEPESAVPVSLDECEDLAREQGSDRWTLAGRFAQKMLPGVFRPGDPVLEVALPPEARLKLEELLESIPRAVFLADDALGWTYQFWQAERKDEVNQSGVKIGADELPAVTQLFTERYMVQFLLHNTIGAWRAGKLLARADGQNGRKDQSEDDLRRAVRIGVGGGYDFSYLRFVRDQKQAWRPAAGWFEKWPRTAAELRVLDPCCGSGHFLVEAFELLVCLRMEEEGLAVQDAVCAVLRDNLYGLEIDPRCAQIAAFNIAFAAWRLVGRPFRLPRLNVACCGLGPNATEAEWKRVAARMEGSQGLEGKRDLFGLEPSLATGPQQALQAGMVALHKIFQQAPELGSLIDPNALLGGDLFQADMATVLKVLPAIVDRERAAGGDDFERAVAAEGMARTVELLTGTYTLVVTNVPFLARRKQSPTLRRFAEAHHSEAKGDLATMFVARIMHWLGESGTQALVAPQNWLFLKTYRKLRERLLKRRTFNAVSRLGPGAFETIGGHVVNVQLNVLSADNPGQDWQMAGMDVSTTRDQEPIVAVEKAALLGGSATVFLVKQAKQFRNVDTRILLAPASDLPLLMTLADYGKGSMTGDKPRFICCFWETPLLRPPMHVKWLNSPASLDHWTGRSEFCKVPLDSPSIRKQRGVGINGHRVFGQPGGVGNKMNRLQPFLYGGEVFDDNVGPILPRQTNSDLTKALWAFVSSPEYNKTVREIDQKLNVTAATLVKVPFDLDHWKNVANEQYPHGLPDPYSDDPTQWLFHGHPCGSVVWDEDAKRLTHGPLRTDSTVLQVAVARLLGYRWPAEHDASMRLSAESRTWVERSQRLAGFADNDGIVCIPPVGGERSAQDRIRELLATAYGQEWSVATERALLASTHDKGRAPASIGDWLRDSFFEQHCRLFHNRPFIWHVWDGRRDGFHALVNYHRLAGPDGDGRRTLESLAYRYLGDWIERQRGEQQEGKAGADARLAAAQDLQRQLERIATGERPLDIFVRWRPLHRQAIGWEPDIDDGVRLNIRPFMRAELRSGGRRGAGILRYKPNVKWGKDRGKEPERDNKDTDKHIRLRHEFPWFWSCPGGGTEQQRTDFQGGPAFDGNRWNNLHYTRAAKEAARMAAETPHA